jgi:hypothetical protein
VAQATAVPSPSATPAPPTATPTPSPTPTPTVPTFLETFDGDPAQPLPFVDPRWNVAIHTRDRQSWYTLDGIDADHGPDCAPPPATHFVDTFEDTVYRCRNHMMTAMVDHGYGAATLTPNHGLDFSAQRGVVRFDLSTARNNGYDWIEVWLTPAQDVLAHPAILGQIQGVPRNGVVINMIPGGINRFTVSVVRDYEIEQLVGDEWTRYETLLTPSARERSTFELRLSRTSASFGLIDYNDAGDDFYWVSDAPIDPPLDWSQAVVQFGHHSFSPENPCGNDGTCGPQTWHWDNIAIAPALPFTILNASQRYAEADPTAFTFAEAAPERAFLRFSAVGERMRVSYDNGASWSLAAAQPNDELAVGSFITYFAPVPRGTTSVLVDGDAWWAGPWHVRDVSIWGMSGFGRIDFPTITFDAH